MSRSNPPFYTGPDLVLPDADDFLHNPSSSNQGAGEDAALSSSDSKGSFLLDWNLHYEEPSVQENLTDSSLFSDLMVDFGNTGPGISTSSFPSDSILELNSPGMEIFGNNEDLLSPKRSNSKSLPPFSGPTQPKSSKASSQAGTKRETKSTGILDCICNQPQGDRFILVCDKCDKWFHCECVGISQEQAEEMATERHIWLCPVCNETTGASNKNQSSSRHTESRSHISTRSQTKGDSKTPVLKIPKKAPPAKEDFVGKRCYLKSCQKRLTNPTHHFCSNTCIDVTVNNLKSFYQIKGLSSADSDRVTLLDKSNMKVLTGMAAPTLGGLASWLRSHPTHVPIKPQPRQIQEAPSSSKQEIRPEVFSNHEEIVRGKARKQLAEILLSRVEKSPEYAKYKDSIPKLADQIEIQLFALDSSISTRYKNRYRNISFSLRDSKNFGLYQRVVSGEVLPEELVQLTTGQLIPEGSNNGKDSKNSSNTDNGTSRGKTHDKQSSVVNYSSGDMPRKNTNIQLKNQLSSLRVSDDHKGKQGGHDSKQSKFQSNKHTDIPESSQTQTEVDIPPPKFSPTLSDSDDHSDLDKVVWKGSISMPNLAKCATNGFLAYGQHHPDMEKILPENVQVHGRIVYSMVWDYLKKIVSSTTKGLVVLKLVPESSGEQLSFTTLFNYFYKRQRCGVAGGCTATVRDLYLLPFAKGDSIPSVLTSLQGPGISSLKEETLLAMIVTNKLPHIPQNAVATKKSEADTKTNQLKAELPKEVSASLTNPSAPLPFSTLHSKTDLPFSSNTELPTTTPSDTFASPLFNPSGLYKPISDDGQDRKDSYIIPYDKVEKESPFSFSLGSKTASDHMFPHLGEILKKTIDDPIVDDALSNLQFKKPLKEEFIPEQKLHPEFGYQYQDQFPPSAHPTYPGTETRPGEAQYSDLQAMRPPLPQVRPHANFPANTDPNQNLGQFNNTSQNLGYYGQDPSVPQHVQPHHPMYPPQSQGQGAADNREYWQQQGVRETHDVVQAMDNFPPHPNQHSDTYERFPPHHWGQPAQGTDTGERYHPFQHDPHHGFPTQPPHEVPQPHPHLQYQPRAQQPHPHLEAHLEAHPETHPETHHYDRDRQEHSEAGYHDQRGADFPAQHREERYDPYSENARQSYLQEEKEKERDTFRHPAQEQAEAGREWKSAYEQARGEERWTGEDRRPADKRHDREVLSDQVYRDYRMDRDREQERMSLEVERARNEFNRLDAARLEERALPPFMRRRLPLRTALTHHLDLTRRELSYQGGRGKVFPLGLSVPSLIERERARLKREYPLEKEVMGAPFKVYRTMESPPKPSFEPISRSRPTLRVRKRERERERARKTPRREESGDTGTRRGEEKSDFAREEAGPQGSKRGEKKSSRSTRRSRSSRNKETTSERQHETSEAKSELAKPASENPEAPDTTATTEGVTSTEVPDTNTTPEVYPQVVQVVQEGGEGNHGSEKDLNPESEEAQAKMLEDENSIKFPPKHLQREKLLAMKEKLQTQTQKEPHSRSSKKGERKRRSRSRSRSRSRDREREPRSGRKRRSRSRERRRAHSRDEIPREKEGVSIREVSRERILRDREDIPRRDGPTSLRERQLLALERERELLRARARMSLPSPSTLEAIRERSPLHVTNFDPRRPLLSPYMRARAIDELRRERLDRGVPSGFRGQFLYQDPRT